MQLSVSLKAKSNCHVHCLTNQISNTCSLLPEVKVCAVPATCMHAHTQTYAHTHTHTHTETYHNLYGGLDLPYRNCWALHPLMPCFKSPTSAVGQSPEVPGERFWWPPKMKKSHSVASWNPRGNDNDQTPLCGEQTSLDPFSIQSSCVFAHCTVNWELIRSCISEFEPGLIVIVLPSFSSTCILVGTCVSQHVCVFVWRCFSGESILPSSGNKCRFSITWWSFLQPPPPLEVQTQWVNDSLVPVQSFWLRRWQPGDLPSGQAFIQSHPACCMRSLHVSDLCLRGLSARALEISRCLLSRWFRFKLHISSKLCVDSVLLEMGENTGNEKPHQVV